MWCLWLKPTRNALGILGGIPKREFTRDSIARKVAETAQAQWPVHAVITNSTYDGLLYNTNWIKQMLDVPSIHFDSAGYPIPISIRSTGEKRDERRSGARKSDFRNAIHP